MISNRVVDYLRRANVPFVRRWHARAISGQQLAASIHVTGFRVAKAVIVDAEGRKWIAVLPVAELVDEGRLAQALGVKRVRLCREEEFEDLFPDCEVGAEPPFGGLYGLPVVCDRRLARAESIVFRAGSHEESIELSFADFERLEAPKLASFAVMPVVPEPVWAEPHPAI